MTESRPEKSPPLELVVVSKSSTAPKMLDERALRVVPGRDVRSARVEAVERVELWSSNAVSEDPARVESPEAIAEVMRETTLSRVFESNERGVVVVFNTAVDSELIARRVVKAEEGLLFFELERV